MHGLLHQRGQLSKCSHSRHYYWRDTTGFRMFWTETIDKFNTEIETKCVLLWTWVHVTEIGVPRDLIYHKCDAFWYLLTYFFFLKLSHSWVEACNLRPLYEGYKGEGPLGVYRMAVYINIRNAKQIVTTGGGMGTSCWESKLCVASWRWNTSRGSRISRRKQKGRESRGKE